MKLKEKTYAAYSGLAKYCRTGDIAHVENLDLRQDRIHHYRRLVFNITNGTLKQAYPITFKLFTDAQWKAIVNDYFENHNAQEYRIWQMPKEFFQFAKKQNYAEKFSFPFLNDLLLFEWIEIDVHTMEDEIFPDYKNEGNIWEDKLVMNPEYRLLQLEYPVHTKKTKEITEADKGNYFLLAYRESENFGVRFMNLSVLYAYTIEQIEEGFTLTEILNTFCELTQTDVSKIDKPELEGFIGKFIKKKVILGFQEVY